MKSTQNEDNIRRGNRKIFVPLYEISHKIDPNTQKNKIKNKPQSGHYVTPYKIKTPYS